MDSPDALSTLTTEELEALSGAAAWYASYHASAVESAAEDRSAYAVGQRERYLALVEALRKLDVNMALPDALLRKVQQAA